MTALPNSFPRVPLKQMDPSMLVFELGRTTDRRLTPHQSEMITSAATMASFLHREQTRSVRGDMPLVPYIEHPLRVALRIVRWHHLDAELLTAALLHDVAEDCAEELCAVFGEAGENALQVLARLYGGRVARLVAEVTNPVDGMSYAEHMSILARSGSEALLIKASDLKDNAGSIKHQMGHGNDVKMLARVRKYLRSIPEIIIGLEFHNGSATARIAAEELREVMSDLMRIANEYDLVL